MAPRPCSAAELQSEPPAGSGSALLPVHLPGVAADTARKTPKVWNKRLMNRVFGVIRVESCACRKRDRNRERQQLWSMTLGCFFTKLCM